MSPRFYSALWIAFFLSAGVLWVSGNFSMLTATVYGFTAFGLTFIGMMCVLPSIEAHHRVHESIAPPAKAPAPDPALVNVKPEAVTSGVPVYRSV
jgi:hypothetical protein